MKTVQNKIDVAIEQEIQLVEGTFTVSEATDVITSLINEKINFHKLQRLSLCEGSLDANTKYPDERIAELEHEKNTALNFLKKCRNADNKVKIDGVLSISFTG